MLKFKLNKDDGLPPIKVERTAEGTAFEIAIAALNIIMWGLIAWMWARLPEQIPVLFDLSGSADGYGSKGNILLTGVVGTFVSALLCFCAYHPRSTVNLPVPLTNAAQIAAAVRLVRIVSMLVTLLFIVIVLGMGGYESLGILILVITWIIILVIGGFMLWINKLR